MNCIECKIELDPLWSEGDRCLDCNEILKEDLKFRKQVARCAARDATTPGWDSS